ncbi:MAG: M48 family metallopeptidase [Defluviitaleaceae bacterium]|nr:M48 family metallopeptidase [Defluviitaleaceae bacterium]
MEYTLTRSNRKTLALYVRNGALEVRAPLQAPKRDIDKFILSKQDWITSKLASSAVQAESRENFTLDYGDTVIYLGKEYPIVSKQSKRIGFADGFYMPPDLTSDEIKYACVQIYRLLAKRDLTNRVLDFAKQMKVMPTAVKINGAKTRWGSCSGRKSLNFSWRLIMADLDVVDYVVVHELAHITEMNHSSQFWAIVADILPDYQERKKRLKELSRRLTKEDWS